MSMAPGRNKHPQTPTRGFSTPEFECRCARAQSLMAQTGTDALLLTTEPEIRYFTGFLSRFWLSPTRPWFLILPASGKPVAVVPSIGAGSFAATWLDDVRAWPSPQPQDEGVSLLADTLTELVGRQARIGLPKGPETLLRMPLSDYHRLRTLLPGMAFTDAAEIIRTLRMIKSAAEIDKIAHICTLVSGVFATLPEVLHAGMSEIEIFRLFKIVCLQNGADDIDYLVGGAGQGGYRDIITPPTCRRTRPGDVLMLDTGAVFDGYYCDFDRNFAIGHASAAVKDAYRDLITATDAGFAAAQAGARCADVFQAMRRVVAKDGDGPGDVGRMGHGLGMQLTEWPSILAGDTTELRPGMVLTLEPSLVLGNGRMMVHEENIVIGAAGPEYLTGRAPQSIPVISGKKRLGL
jgi:Xaa-Pro aminopeptidase